jgi:hypothetical protein
MSDQPIIKASTYTEHTDTETQRQTSMPSAGFEPTIPVTKQPRPRGHQDRLPVSDRLSVKFHGQLEITKNKSLNAAADRCLPPTHSVRHYAIQVGDKVPVAW